MFNLKGKIAVITGASRGIGRQTALSMARAGAQLVLVSRNEERLRQVAAAVESSGGQALPVPADVTVEEQVSAMTKRTLERYGTVDILVNNAGDPGPTLPVQELSLAGWHQVIDSSLTGTFLCCKYIVPVMIENGGGRIINLSSAAGKTGLPLRIGYCAAKMGLIGLTRCLANELGRYNITVNAVAPGPVKGERWDYVVEQQAKQRNIDPQKFEQTILRASPLRRPVKEEDIAAMIVYLAGEAGANTTGEDININAGSHFG